ncbi:MULTISPECIES: DNA recombination protein RmuC [unclassified Lentimonas]|uniref:DNA recombination protein RmuC n=1 Tax=unclassified Lentimonas TaxID=2630993 RepID=UPI00132208B2|nr:MULTISPECIES: DNA recombination protein RmuC [unclassified Lentimonas]CAA6676472.1 DNA recombination protein RmuC [Lentimonas sp. CC4]CAA6685312.1 DNA recombination protein RmuC [Lentimonas sp. CC6]CAA7074964.1 DNA recombination protein RmuC [Lentimonas sp. CC4]CAA7168361.1 DNA recombination protein RmuC [Lentimonas sp. CC21]CAA7180605.1 DNA recombination protein RmuC [Lentimonas sp. CC8]
MELMVALVVGVLVGAGLVFVLLRSGFQRSESAADAAQDELQALRAECSSVREALARTEAQYDAELKAAAEKLALLEEAKANLQDSFKALSSEALSKNNESFLNLAKTTLEKYQEGAKSDLAKRQEAINKTVEPVGEALKVFNERVAKIEQRRTETDASLQQQLKHLAESQVQLSRTTGSLVQALRAPQVRGQWGEMQLRRTVEMAGMINYCDFEEQASVETDEGQRQRPDMLIRLPNERVVVVDSKVPLAAYLDALQSEDPDVQKERMVAHARHIREHIKGLSAKSYWTQFDNAPEFVVLFIPNETIFSAALEQDPQLIELGVLNKVILATPTTLIALLKAIAYGWQQEAVAREAKEIAALGKELYERIGVVAGHFAKVGKSLGQSVDHYNKAVNSVESRLLVTAKKFEALDSASADALPEVKGIEKLPALPKEVAPVDE